MITANGFNFYFHFWFSKNQLFSYLIPTILDLKLRWAISNSDDCSDLIGGITDKKTDHSGYAHFRIWFEWVNPAFLFMNLVELIKMNGISRNGTDSKYLNHKNLIRYKIQFSL